MSGQVDIGNHLPAEALPSVIRTAFACVAAPGAGCAQGHHPQLSEKTGARMGLFGSKKNNAGKNSNGAAQKAPTEVIQSSRKSVRRVVASAKPPASGKVPVPQRAPATAPQPQPQQQRRPISIPQPAPDPGLDDVQLPPAFAEAEQLDLGRAPAATPGSNRGGGSKPILSSNAPDFSGSLGSARVAGPSRTGDPVLFEFLTGKGGLLTIDQAEAVRVKAESEAIAIDEAAVRMGLLTEEQLVNSLSQETWVPHLKVDKYEIRKKALDTVTREDAQHFGVFPVDKLGNLLTLAMVNPLDSESIRQLEAKTGLDIKKVVATRSEVATAIDKYYGGKVVPTEGSRSFSQDVSDKPKSPTQMLSRGIEAAAPAANSPAFDLTPSKAITAIANVTPDISADIQDIDDLLGGEESIAPAILEPVSIKPEESNDALELTDAPITQALHRESDVEFGLHEAPAVGTGALDQPRLDLEKTDPILPPAAKVPVRSGRGQLPSSTARVAVGGVGSKVVNLVPVLEEEFRYVISHGKSKVFERWVALQSRNRIVNAVAVEKELDGVLAGLYAVVRKAS